VSGLDIRDLSLRDAAPHRREFILFPSRRIATQGKCLIGWRDPVTVSRSTTTTRGSLSRKFAVRHHSGPAAGGAPSATACAEHFSGGVPAKNMRTAGAGGNRLSRCLGGGQAGIRKSRQPPGSKGRLGLTRTPRARTRSRSPDFIDSIGPSAASDDADRWSEGIRSPGRAR